MSRTLSQEYLAGLFDGEGSISLQNYTDRRGYNVTCLHIRISNNNRFVLKQIQNVWGGTLVDYKPKYAGSNLHHALAISKVKAKEFLEYILPNLVIKRNSAWIVLCFLGHGMRERFGNSFKGKQGWQRLTSDEIEIRKAVVDTIKKINSGKGKKAAVE